MKKWFKQLFIICLVAFMIISPFFSITANATTSYVKSDEDDYGNEYYIIKGEDVTKLFDFTVNDVEHILNWVFQFKTYTVIKTYGESDNKQYKVYFNTPNLQSIVKNEIIMNIDDGYTDNTYNPDESERLVKVGTSTDMNNVIEKYGFNIPNYTYSGEYPKETMTVAGIIPTHWYDKVWRAVKSVFTGASFLKAPSADNFNTIVYHNHRYKDNSDYLINFFQNYYMPYFVNRIHSSDDYFTNPEDVVNESVDCEDKDKAEATVKENKKQEKKYQSLLETYTKYCTTKSNNNTCLCLTNINFIEYNANGFVVTKEDETSHVATTVEFNNALDLAIDSSTYRESWKQWADIHKNFVLDVLDLHDEDWTQIDWSTKKSQSEYISKFFNNLENPSKIKENKETNETTLVYHNKYEVEFTIYEELYTKSFDLVDLDEEIDNNTKERNEYNEITDTSPLHPLAYKFTKQEFIPFELEKIHKEYKEAESTIDKYNKYIDKINTGKAIDVDKVKKGTLPTLYYNQCMIDSEGESDTECWSTKYGEDKTTLSLADIYVNSGIYKYTEKVKKDTISKTKAIKIIKALQEYCGPYYTNVMQNMVKLMEYSATAENNTEAIKLVDDVDVRVMPYDVSTLTLADKENYTVVDPRVSIYKKHTIGKLISDLSISMNILSLVKPTQFIINIAGRITELSIFMQELCNFDILDKYELSPTSMWTNGYALLLISVVILVFFFNTCKIIIKNGTKGGYRVVLGFIVLVFEIGIFTILATTPDKVWNLFKNTSTTIMNLGEATTMYNNPNLNYLYTDVSDQEVTYYMPYLDIWSKYNTGYGILNKKHQVIDTESDLPELEEIQIPKINGKKIKHYSILLADSFNYYGDSKSVVSSVNVKINNESKIVNGTKINNNAYRVVDHFLAPRVEITQNGEDLTLTTTENENYNKDFQQFSIDLIVKLLNCLLSCFFSIIKLCIFLWQWWLYYILFFKVILDKSNVKAKKTWLQIILETISPTIALCIFGFYSGVALTLGMQVNGILGLIVILLIFILTTYIIGWWYSYQNGRYFPSTLKPIYYMSTLFGANHTTKVQKENEDIIDILIRNAKTHGIPITREEAQDFDTLTNILFNPDGTYKYDKSMSVHNDVYRYWYILYKNKLHISDTDVTNADTNRTQKQNALSSYEQREKEKENSK